MDSRHHSLSSQGGGSEGEKRRRLQSWYRWDKLMWFLRGRDQGYGRSLKKFPPELWLLRGGSSYLSSAMEL